MYVLFPIVSTGWEVVFNHLKQWLKQQKKVQDELCSNQVDERQPGVWMFCLGILRVFVFFFSIKF